MKEIQIGAKLKVDSKAAESLLACAMGSGELPVYATPAMAALMENAAATLLKNFLDEGETSVGIRLNLAHTSATPKDAKVWAEAEITAVDRKKVTFSVKAYDETGEIGSAEHDRFVVDAEKFLAKANAKLQ
ncbi:MAG: thioesterase family protein [Candidatus Merdivicinus sp.]|jgi:fluoroacetyl-CoA thioesterase